MDRIGNRDPEASTTVREVFDELAGERGIAYTTVMSTMDSLHTKGWRAREHTARMVWGGDGWRGCARIRPGRSWTGALTVGAESRWSLRAGESHAVA